MTEHIIPDWRSFITEQHKQVTNSPELSNREIVTAYFSIFEGYDESIDYLNDKIINEPNKPQKEKYQQMLRSFTSKREKLRLEYSALLDWTS